VLFVGGPPGALMAQRGVFKIDEAPLLDTYTLLAKAAETMATMHKLTGVCVSRQLLYASPPADLVRKVGAAYGVSDLRNG
jgi:allantoin racemase